MPGLANDPTCLVRTPKGVMSVPNPVYRYKFHPVPGTALSPDEKFEIGKYKTLPYTVRSLGEDGVVDIEAANKRLEVDGQ